MAIWTSYLILVFVTFAANECTSLAYRPWFFGKPNWYAWKNYEYQRPLEGRSDRYPNSAWNFADYSIEEYEDLSRAGTTATKDCVDMDTNAIGCRNTTGCFYCCSDQFCHENRDEASDCIPGCSNYCGDWVLCTAQGCIYNYQSDECAGTIGARRYSVNLCGKEHTSRDTGIWYASTGKESFKSTITDDGQLLHPTKPAPDVLLGCFINHNIPIQGTTDGYVYQSHRGASKTGKIVSAIPILEDGLYEIVLHFAEIWKPNKKRRMAISIEGIEARNTVTINKYGKAVDVVLQFTISRALSIITFNGESKLISEKWKKKVNRWKIPHCFPQVNILAADTQSDNHIPTLAGFYIKKLRN